MATDWFSVVTGASETPAVVRDLAARDMGPPLSDGESRVRAKMADARESQAHPKTVDGNNQVRGVDARTPAETEPRGQGEADWWRELQAADAYYSGRGNTGGTFDTVHGGPQVPALRDSPEPAGIVTSLRTGAIEDPDARIRALAAERFPNERNPERRYGLVDGEIVYRGDDGSFYREQGTGGKVASWAGENLPAMLGAGVGAAMGGPPGAALGGATGEAVRKMAGEAQGDEQTVMGNVVDIGAEAAFDWAGAKVGDMVGKHIVNRRVVRDLPRFNAANSKQLQKLAQARGIILTPAEASNLGSLIQRQSMLNMGADEAGDLMRQFYGNRAAQVQNVIDDFIGKTPPAQVAGRSAREVGAQVIDDAAAARETATRAGYRMLDKANPRIGEKAFTALEEDDLVRGYVDKVVSDPKFAAMDQPRDSFKVVDRAQKLMADESAALKKAGRKYEARVLEGKRQELVRTMEAVVPGYRDIRRTFAEQSRFVEDAEKGIEGVLAGLKDTRLRKAADILLSPGNVSPDDVGKARRTFMMQGRTKDWDALVNQRLRDVFERQKSTIAQGDATIGPKFHTAVYGSKRDRDIMKAAMGPQRFRDLDDLMAVLEAIGRVPKQQSITHFAGEAAKQEARSAAPVTTFLRNLKVSDPGGELLDALTDRSVEKWRAMMARIVTSPDAVGELEKLRVLRGMSPTSQKKLSVASVVLEKAGVLSTQAAVRERPTRLPSREAEARAR